MRRRLLPARVYLESKQNSENMCEITNKSFHENYCEIVRNIRLADFIALDCEYSGLLKHEKNGLSLFDTPAERYEKLRDGLDEFLALQLGISTFTHNQNNKYDVATYTFYLFPRTYSGQHMFFSCESHCIQFLCNQNFDFNKVFYDGIPFVCASEESKVRREIVDGTLISKIKSNLSNSDREIILSFCHEVNLWWSNALYGTCTAFDTSGLDPLIRYLIKNEIETRFRDVTVYHGPGGKIRVKKQEMNVEQRKENECSSKIEFDYLVMGFTGLMKEIAYMRKPIVGHNLFLDLLMLYKMFFAPLPRSYYAFKSEIAVLFPALYDIKYIGGEIKTRINRKDLWSSNTLKNLYKFFKEGRGTTIVPQMPVVEYKSFCSAPRCEHFHDSGYDSYCIGFVFLKLAHLHAMWNDKFKIFRRVLVVNGPSDYFSAVQECKNKISLRRSQVGHILLDGPDPEGRRPSPILVTSTGLEPLDVARLSGLISKFDQVDIKQLTDHQVLIATTNENRSKLICRQLLTDPSYKLSKYKVTARSALPGIFILGTAAVFCIIYVKQFLSK